MIRKRFSFASGLVLLITCALTHLEAWNWDREPRGVKMCRKLCLRTYGCSSYGFGISRLSCSISDKNDTEASPTSFTLNQERREDILNDSVSRCAMQAKVLHTKTKGVTCVPAKAVKIRIKKPKIPKISNRFILANIRKRRTESLLEFDPRDSSLNKHPFLRAKYVTALTYVKSVDKLLISTKYPMHIVSSGIHKRLKKILVKSKMASALAVDEGYKLVFMIIQNPFPFRVARMDLDGKHFKFITSTGMDLNVYSLTFNPRQREVIIPNGLTLTLLSYEGEKKESLDVMTDTPSVTHAVFFDIHEDTLYYNVGGDIMKRQWSQNTSLKIAVIKFPPYVLQCHGPYMYVASTLFSRLGIGVVSKSNGLYVDLQIPKTMTKFAFAIFN